VATHREIESHRQRPKEGWVFSGEEGKGGRLLKITLKTHKGNTFLTHCGQPESSPHGRGTWATRAGAYRKVGRPVCAQEGSNKRCASGVPGSRAKQKKRKEKRKWNAGAKSIRSKTGMKGFSRFNRVGLGRELVSRKRANRI